MTIARAAVGSQGKLSALMNHVFCGECFDGKVRKEKSRGGLRCG